MEIITALRLLGLENPGVHEFVDTVLFSEFVTHPVIDSLDMPVMPGGWPGGINA